MEERDGTSTWSRLGEISAYLLAPLMIGFGTTAALSASGARLGIVDIAGDWLVGLGGAVAILFLIVLLPVPLAHRRVLTLLWVVRCGVTLGIGPVFEALYIGDGIHYWRNGTLSSTPWNLVEFGEGNETMTGLTGIINLLAPGYTFAKVIWSLVGLAAVYTYYRAVCLAIGRDIIGLLYVLGLFPSILFWTSILGKDPLVSFGIAVFCYGAVGLLTTRKVHYLVFVAAGLLIAAAIRVWLGVIFLAPLVATFVLAGRVSMPIKIGFVALAIPGFMVALQGFADKFSIESAQDVVATADKVATSWAIGGSAQTIQGGFGSIGDMIAFMPVGAFTALFRPLPGEVLNPFGMLAGLENAVLLGLFVTGIWRHRLRWLVHPLLLWCALTLVCWSAIYGFPSYQNLGTAFRFAVQTTPMLLMMSLYLCTVPRGTDFSKRGGTA